MSYMDKIKMAMYALAGTAIIALTSNPAKADFYEAIQTAPGKSQLEFIVGHADVNEVIIDGDSKDVDIEKTFLNPTMKYRTKDGKNIIMVGGSYVDFDNYTAGQSNESTGDVEITLGKQCKSGSTHYMGSVSGTIPIGSYDDNSKVNTTSKDYKVGGMIRATHIFKDGSVDAGLGVEHDFSNDDNTGIIRFTPSINYDQMKFGVETIGTTDFDSDHSITTGILARYTLDKDLTPGDTNIHVTCGAQTDAYKTNGPKKDLYTVRIRCDF